ncbi:hypothetical protein GWC77_28675, partial [Paraburkholderia sp. NMBU_R16]|nr:hypothetical protein [Paraburkholderia sp. NMBU_R16]
GVVVVIGDPPTDRGQLAQPLNLEDISPVEIQLLNRPRKRVTPDLPPTNRASQNLVKFVFGEEDEHEEAFYGRANHRVSEGSRGR